MNKDTQFLTQMRQSIQQRLIPFDDSIFEKFTKRVPHSFLNIFLNNCTTILAEIKFASPLKNRLSQFTNEIDIATHYLNNNAAALSILTEPEYFKGSLQYLLNVRSAFPNAYLLMKDFILSEKQLIQALYYGADAVLLIVKFLTPNELISLYNKAVALKLTPLVEVNDLAELRLAESLGAKLIGVNNRNLQTLNVDLTTAEKLITYSQTDAIFLALSGIKSASYVHDLKQLGYKGFLIGSHLISSQNPGLTLQKLLHEVECHAH